MTYTPQAQRLMKLARRALKLERQAYDNHNHSRAFHFAIKLERLTSLAIKANRED